MPLQQLTFPAAIRNFSDNPESKWWAIGGPQPVTVAPSAAAGMRLREKYYLPRVEPKFRFDSRAKIFTMGSCFARNLEETLVKLGFSVVSSTDQFHERWSPAVAPPENVDARTHSTYYLNKYNTFSMSNEFLWAERAMPASEHPAVVRVADDRWADLNAHNILSGTTEADVRARREIMGKLVRRAFDADVIVLTLGLTEVWYDTVTGIYLNDPAVSLRATDPLRYELRVLSSAENLAAMNQIHKILSRAAKPGWRMVVTVSPVPLLATFTSDDVLTANTYSKSVLRAVAEEFCRRHDNVDYFPSYEMVMNSDPQHAWLSDRRHVAESMVEVVVEHFSRNFVVTQGT